MTIVQASCPWTTGRAALCFFTVACVTRQAGVQCALSRTFSMRTTCPVMGHPVPTPGMPTSLYCHPRHQGLVASDGMRPFPSTETLLACDLLPSRCRLVIDAQPSVSIVPIPTSEGVSACYAYAFTGAADRG
jgi:hypothetical protein